MTKRLLAIGIFILLANCRFSKESKSEKGDEVALEVSDNIAIRSVENNGSFSLFLPNFKRVEATAKGAFSYILEK